MISDKEILMVRQALETARAKGAQEARATLNKSSENMISTLNGEVDKVTRCEDCSLSIVIFADGRYGSFSTNKLDPEALDAFIGKAVGIVRMLAPDPCRKLPERDRICTDAVRYASVRMPPNERERMIAVE